jgi:hypothetical protein
MRVLRSIVRFIMGPNLFRDRPADQTVLTARPLTGSERMIQTDDPSQAQDAAADVRRRGNLIR